MQRGQNGSYWKKGPSWFLQYYSRQLDANGKVVSKKTRTKLGPAGSETEPPLAIKNHAAEILARVNEDVKPHTLMPFVEFVDMVYMPACKAVERASTFQTMVDLWRIARPHVPATLTLRSFGPAHGKKILDDVNAERVRSKYVFPRLKSFLRGALAYAIEREILGNVPNAMSDVKCKRYGARPKVKRTYDESQIKAMLAVLDEPVRTIVLCAAKTGLRKSELQGLTWGDLNVSDAGSSLTIRRTVWFGRRQKLDAGGPVYVLPYSIGETKTEASAAEVPIDNQLLAALLALKAKAPNATGWMFASKHGPRHLANLQSVHIEPKLAAAGVEWFGWHSFRHSLATRMVDAGVQPKTVQAMMRHRDVHTTLQVYSRSNKASVRRAVEVVNQAIA